ncbi:hypothetical protein [Novosphingobium sp. JCM 18896]|uniref:hypothetical protein n=1 Tax=Novosphingobium sp. JCM 18896 TaxID=2989731 RepID=UPI0022232B09|nr:hypothetical protein [Novosphingobium sp. JCM 18896]MCW1431369.1 hypothetical protein [Novosphingobium sp. JCM 18896]
MSRITAQGTFRIHEGWRDHTSSARRAHIHGKLLPMDRPLKDEGTGYEHLSIWDEQPSLLAGVGWGILILSILAFLWVITQ